MNSNIWKITLCNQNSCVDNKITKGAMVKTITPLVVTLRCTLFELQEHYASLPQHLLYFLPEPHGHSAFLPTLLPSRLTVETAFCSVPAAT